MNMLIGQQNPLPYMIGQSLQKPNVLPMNKTANIFSLRYAMVDRVSGPRTSCGSCGK
jgi:hypothetical protein